MFNYVAILGLAVMVVVSGAPARSKRSNAAGCGLDIAFVLDTSGVMGNDGFELEKKFVRGFLDEMVAKPGVSVGPQGIMGAIVTFNGLHSILATSYTLGAFNNSLNDATFSSGFENPAPALSIVQDAVFQKMTGDRPNVPNLVIFVSDGIVTNGASDPTVPAAALRKSGATIISVSVPRDQGKNKNYVNLANLIAIAGGSQNVFGMEQTTKLVSFLSSPPLNLAACA